MHPKRAARSTVSALALALAAGLALGGCSLASGYYVMQDMSGAYDPDGRKARACSRARTNLMSAADPIEAEEWRVLLEDLDCPTVEDQIGPHPL